MKINRMTWAISFAMSLGIIAGTHPAPQNARANDNSEIPGQPLPSLSLVGQIGGATVDLVYSLEVERGTSLLLTLRGADGAELGLYVFGDDATSVLTSTPLASSAKPGADQSISMQFFEASKIYINVNGRNEDQEYAFQLNSSIVVDRTPPVIRIATADRVGTGHNVCASIEAFDGISGVQSVSVAELGTPEPFAWTAYRGNSRYCADLDLSDGRHSLVVRARNRLGMVSTASAGEIQIDNQVPDISLGSPKSGVMLDPRGALTFNFSEPVWFEGPRRAGVVAVAQTGETLSGKVEISLNRTKVRWIPNQAVAPGTVIVAMLGEVRDEAGNVTTPNEPHIVVRKQRTNLSIEVLRLGPKRVFLRVSGSRNLSGETVSVEGRSGRTWAPIDEIKLLRSGTKISFSKKEWRQVRVVWLGDEQLHVSRAESQVFQ